VLLSHPPSWTRLSQGMALSSAYASKIRNAIAMGATIVGLAPLAFLRSQEVGM